MDIPTHLVPTQSSRKEHVIATHCVDVDPSVPPDAALDPNFWQHLVAKFRVGDEVIVRPKDLSYRLHADVVAVDPAGHWAKLRKLSLVEGGATAIGAKDEGGYRIDRDPVQQWRILNGRDLIAKDFATEDEARAALTNMKSARSARKAA